MVMAMLAPIVPNVFSHDSPLETLALMSLKTAGEVIRRFGIRHGLYSLSYLDTQLVTIHTKCVKYVQKTSSTNTHTQITIINNIFIFMIITLFCLHHV